ncbi:Uncharacterised protein [Mycobacteroides abscessus]|nr:Uncharacterised protein [Mycobacteroides abscessus]
MDRPSTGPAPSSARTAGTGRSPWPMCTTGAPVTDATSARSFTAHSAPCSVATRATTSWSSSSRATSSVLSRSCTTSTPPASAARRKSSRSPRSSRASVQR